VLEEEDAAAALPGFDGAHESGCACSDDCDVEGWVAGGLGHGQGRSGWDACPLEYSRFVPQL
jgi:hypothetical protein